MNGESSYSTSRVPGRKNSPLHQPAKIRAVEVLQGVGGQDSGDTPQKRDLDHRVHLRPHTSIG